MAIWHLAAHASPTAQKRRRLRHPGKSLGRRHARAGKLESHLRGKIASATRASRHLGHTLLRHSHSIRRPPSRPIKEPPIPHFLGHSDSLSLSFSIKMPSPRLLLSLALPLLPMASQAADWPQYRGMMGDGATPEKIAKPWTTSPKIVWKAPEEGGFASMAVAGGKAFTLALREIDGAKQETLVALDANSGKELWVAPLNVAKYQGGGDSGA